MTLTVKGDDLTCIHEMRENGLVVHRELPDEALPPCEECEKPELGPLNREAVELYQRIGNQQMFNGFSGHVLGLRFEAVVAAITWYEGAGMISDPDAILERVLALDQVVRGIRNAKIDAKASKGT